MPFPHQLWWYVFPCGIIWLSDVELPLHSFKSHLVMAYSPLIWSWIRFVSLSLRIFAFNYPNYAAEDHTVGPYFFSYFFYELFSPLHTVSETVPTLGSSLISRHSSIYIGDYACAHSLLVFLRYSLEALINPSTPRLRWSFICCQLPSPCIWKGYSSWTALLQYPMDRSLPNKTYRSSMLRPLSTFWGLCKLFRDISVCIQIPVMLLLCIWVP